MSLVYDHTLKSYFDQFNKKAQLPAPNQYFPRKVEYKQLIQIRSKSWAKEPSRSNGPATYQLRDIPERASSAKPQINRFRRFQDKKPDPTPAGADYNINITSIKRSAPQYSLAGRRIYQEDTGPGPKYNLQQYRAKSTEIQINKFNREWKIPNRSPGPAAHTPIYTRTTKSAPSYSIKKGYDPVVGTPSKGPATYTPKLYPYDGQQIFTNFGREGDRGGYIPETPGPGSYTVNKRPARSYSAGFTMGGRYQQKIEETPGPGAYNSRYEYIKRPISYEITMRPKHNVGANWQNVSMGNNAIGTNIDVKQTKMNDIDVRASLSKPTPGPGEYNVNHESVLKRVVGGESIKNDRGQLQQINNNPGPGDYGDLQLGLRQGKPVPPKIQIKGRSCSAQPTAHQIPVPTPAGGDYQPECGGSSNTAPKFTFGFRRFQHKDNFPGPGTYQKPPGIGEGPKFRKKQFLVNQAH